MFSAEPGIISYLFRGAANSPHERYVGTVLVGTQIL
jgi:hypothetical protein